MLGWNEIPEMVNLTRNNVYTTPILAHTHTRGVKANTINDFSKDHDSQLPGIFYHVFPQRENWIEASWGTWRLYMPSGNQPWTVAMENLQMEILMGKSSNYSSDIACRLCTALAVQQRQRSQLGLRPRQVASPPDWSTLNHLTINGEIFDCHFWLPEGTAQVFLLISLGRIWFQ
jgi:hypothetical protein